MSITAAVAAVFTSSTPESRPDWCDSVGRWRVGHADVLEALASEIDGDCYVAHHSTTPSGRLQIFVGLRMAAHGSADYTRLLEGLRALGLKCRAEKSRGRLSGVVVTDRLTKAEA